MKKLTKALKNVIKGLEVKDLPQLAEMPTDKLNKHLLDLNKCYDYDMSEEENEIVETLISDIDGILKDRLAEQITLDMQAVADKKAPKKTTKKTTKETDKDTAKETDKPKAERKAKTKADTKENKPKAPKRTAKNTEKTATKKTLKDVLKWKSLVKMSYEDNIHYVYVVDIEQNFLDVICRSTEVTTLVYQFDSEALEKGVYVAPDGEEWKLEYMGYELKQS